MVVTKSYRSLVELIEFAGLIPHRDRICCSSVSVQYSPLSRINCYTAAIWSRWAVLPDWPIRSERLVNILIGLSHLI